PALVLTPHVGEMRRLTQRLAPELENASVVDQAAQFSARFGAWVVLKSATTYVFSPTGLRSVHPPGTAELATAGTGDTLAGILGAAMTTLDPDSPEFTHRLFRTLTAGVRLHAMAGELAAADGGVVVSTHEMYIRKAKQQGLEYKTPLWLHVGLQDQNAGRSSITRRWHTIWTPSPSGLNPHKSWRWSKPTDTGTGR